MGTSTHVRTFRALVALILVCGVSARTVFYPRTEYHYEYTGQVTSGIPSINNEVNGLGIKCNVIVVGDSNSITVQLDNVRAFSGVTVDNKLSKEIHMLYQTQNMNELKYPFKITYDGDTLNNIEVTNEDIPESVNIKKALAVLLTINLEKLDGQTLRPSGGQGFYNPAEKDLQKTVFQVLEDGIEGQCVSRYILERLPWEGKPWSRVLNVTKKRDSDNCQEKSTMKTSINEPKKCIGCESESLNFINHGVKTQYNINEEGGELILETAEAFGRGVFTPLPPKGDSIKSKQYQMLTLIKVQKSGRSSLFTGRGKQFRTLGIVPEEVEQKARFKRELLYTKTSEKVDIAGHKTFDYIKETDRLRKSNPMLRAQMILDKSTADCLDLYNCTMDIGLFQVTNLVDQLRQGSYEDLDRFYSTNQNNDQKRTLAIDSLAMTGTDASILLIKKLIEDRKLTGETAVQVVSTLPAYALEPQPALLEELWALCKNTLLKESRQLLVTALAAFGEMANQACAPKESLKTIKPYHVKPVGCPSTLITRYIQELMTMYEDSHEPWQRTAVMFAISKMGLNQTLDYLAPYLKSKMFSLPVGHRLEIMMAMYEMGPSRQSEVVELVLPIFYNKSLTAEERIFAFDVIAYITTSQEVMNELALSTWDEPSDQVAVYIYTHLKNLAELTSPCWKPIALRNEKALPLAKPVKSGLLDSGYHLHHSKSEKWGLHSVFGMATVRSSQSLTPRATYTNLVQEIGGYYYSLLEFSSVHEGLQSVFDNLIGPKADFTTHKQFSDIFQSPPQQGPQNTYDNVDGVNIVNREDEKFYSRFLITYLQDRNRLFFIDEHTLDDIRTLGILPHNKDLASGLRDGISINYRKHLMILDNQLKFPSIIGTPMVIATKMPAIVDVKGRVSATATKTGITNALSSLTIKPEITTTLGLGMWAGIHMENVFDGTVSSAGVASKFYLSMPFNAQITVDLIRQSFNMVLKKPQPQSGSGANRRPYGYGVNLKPNPSMHWKLLPMLSKYQPESGFHQVHHLRTTNQLFTTKIPEVLGTWVVEKDSKHSRDRADRYMEETKQSPMDSLNFWWVPRYFTYENREYEESVLLDSEIEVNANWKRTPTPYEAEIWQGKSSLQQLRPWNIIPEWRDVPVVVCAVHNPNAKLEDPESKSWFGKIKDKVTSLGRSGESDSYEENLEQSDQPIKTSATAQQRQMEVDRGRGLHPHHKETGENSESGSVYEGTSFRGTLRRDDRNDGDYGSQSGSSSTYGSQSYGTQSGSFGSYGSQSGSSGNYGGQSGSQYGGVDSYSQTHTQHGGQSGLSQTHLSGHDDDFSQKTDDFSQKTDNYGQTKYGEEDFSQSQTSYSSQGAGLGQLGYGQLGPQGQHGPGQLGHQGQHGPGQLGPGQYGPGQLRPGESVGPILPRIPKKSKVKKLKITDEGSQTLIAIQVKTSDPIKDRRINMEITILDNALAAVKKVHANVDFNQIYKRENQKIRYEVCFNGYFFQGHSGCPHKPSTTPAFDMKLSWGAKKCDDVRTFISVKGSYGIRENDQNIWNQYQRMCPQEASVGVHASKECAEAYLKATALTKATYEIRYTEAGFNLLADKFITSHMRCNPAFSLIEQNIMQKTDDGLIILNVEYDMHGKTLFLVVQRPHGMMQFDGIPYEHYFGLLGPRNSEMSSLYRLGNTLTNGDISTNCVITTEGVRTFNGLTYNYTLRSCSHVIAKDCSSSRLFSVIASDTKISIEIYGHRIESTYIPSPVSGAHYQQRPQIMIDGKVTEIGRENEFSVIRSEGDEDVFIALVSANGPYVTVKSPPMGVSVTYSKNTISVEVSQFWRGKLCGMCGEDTDDSQTTLLGPDKCLYGEPQYFAQSYQILDGSGHCGMPVNSFRGQGSRPCKPQFQSGGLNNQYGGNYGSNFGSGGFGSGSTTDYSTGTRRTDLSGTDYGTGRVGGSGHTGSLTGSSFTTDYGSNQRFSETGENSGGSSDYGSSRYTETKITSGSSTTRQVISETYGGTGSLSGSSSTDLETGRFTGAGSKSSRSSLDGYGVSGTYTSGSSGGILPIYGAGSQGATPHKNYNSNAEEPLITARNVQPLGGLDEGRCYVRRNQLKRQTLTTSINYSPLTKTKKACFSTEAIRQCRASCIGLDFLPINVKFHCYEESSNEASRLIALVDNQPLTDMVDGNVIDFVEEMLIPQKCIPKY